MNTINAYASPDAHVIYGAAYDDSLGDEIRVTVVATGLSRANARAEHRWCRAACAPAPTTWPTRCPWPAAPGRARRHHRRRRPGRLRRHAVPSVWRTNRTAAAARVDALSSGGMDDLEIPAFLRKQAD
jgi:cell division protein FtsZ